MRTQNCPECQWVPVIDGTGRRRLEMRWVRPRSGTESPVALARAA
jgi:hypothetical protein